MACAGYSLVDGPDVDGNLRQAIAFELVPVDALKDAPLTGSDALGELDGRTLGELRELALQAPGQVPAREAIRNIRVRSEAVRRYVLARAGGRCEACNERAPFNTRMGRPYLEPHHTRRLSDGGPDDPRWVIAVCPNCHRRAHYSHDAVAFNDTLEQRLLELEQGQQDASP
jgi:5-methylcytosine-specific restriction enzyme A